MKVSEVLTSRAARGFGWVDNARLITETLNYLDELESRGVIPRPNLRAGEEYSEFRESPNERAVPSDGAGGGPPAGAGARTVPPRLSSAAELAPARLSRASIYSELRESLNERAVPSDVLTQVVEDFFERFCMPDGVIAEGRRLFSARNLPGGREQFEAWLLEHGRALFGMPGEDLREEAP